MTTVSEADYYENKARLAWVRIQELEAELRGIQIAYGELKEKYDYDIGVVYLKMSDVIHVSID